MPDQYEAMRDKFAEGAPKDSPKYNRAQARAAAIYNARHPNKPVTGKKKGKHSTAAAAKALAKGRG